MKPLHLTVLLILTGVSPGVLAAACTDGVSEGAACSHVAFVGHLSAAEMGGDGEVLNDIWGWVDETSGGAEYAIVGMQDGTAFLRLGDSGDPVFLGRLPASDGEAPIAKAGGSAHSHKRCHDDLCGEEDSAWRDVKVFGNYAYIVSEAAGHGVQVFDLRKLSGLSGSPAQPQNRDGYYGGLGHAHNIFINEDTARAYVVGHNGPLAAGGLHILDLSDPANPQFLAELNDDGYTHDVQCVAYTGPDPDIVAGSELCFASNEDTLTVWDVSDVSAGTGADGARILSRATYSQTGYTHQGWLSADQRYFFLNDELDELDTGSRTHLRVFDVSDVDAPVLAAEYFAPTLAIDHNNYVHGRWLYQSNYAAGLRILDIRNPLRPVQAGYFDPQPSDEADFIGTWSNFGFPSGLVAFTDIRNGLYVVRPTLSEAGTAPDLAVTMTLAAGSAGTGDTVSGAFTVSNGAAVDASDPLVTLHLPQGETFDEFVAPPDWNCNDVAAVRVIECRKTALPVNATEDFSFAFAPRRAGSTDVIVMVYAEEADAFPDDNLDLVTLAVTSGANANADGGGGGGAWYLLLAFVLVCAGLRRGHVRR